MSRGWRRAARLSADSMPTAGAAPGADNGRVSARCPECGAAVRVGAPWCALCYAPLGAPTGPASTVPAPTVPAPTVPAPRAAGAGQRAVATAAVAGHDADSHPRATPQPPGQLARGWPCRTCGTSVAWDARTCAGCGTAFLSAASEPGQHRAGTGIAARLVAMPRGGRLALALAAGVLLAVVVPLMLALL